MTTGIKILGIAVIAAAFLFMWWKSRRQAGNARARQSAAAANEPLDEQSLEDLRVNAHTLVWGGFMSRDEIIEVLPDIAVVEVDTVEIAKLVDAELALKHAAEKTWPENTGCDRLDEAFEALNQRGIFSLQYAGYTQSDAHSDLAEGLADADPGQYTGYCFYTAQDVEHLIDDSRSLYLGFGTNLEQASEAMQALGAPNNVGAVEAGRIIVNTMREFGFDTAWDETPQARIELRGFDWKRRGP
jgi:hypothetical protein